MDIVFLMVTIRHSRLSASCSLHFIVCLAPLPVISSLAHTQCDVSGSALIHCPIAGGNTLTINGQFYDGTLISVSPSAIVVGSLSFNGPRTQITFTLSSGSGIHSPILVTTQGGTSSSSSFSLAYAALPTLTGMAHLSCAGSGPLIGCPPAGTGVLTLTGTNFYGPSSTISILPASVCTAKAHPDYQTITCTLSAGTPGSNTSSIRIVTNGGTSSSLDFYLTWGN
jgi:hypothetical protein